MANYRSVAPQEIQIDGPTTQISLGATVLQQELLRPTSDLMCMNVAIGQRPLLTTFLSEGSKLAELETFPKNSEVYSQTHCRRAYKGRT